MSGMLEATRLPWTRVVELASHLESSFASQGQVDGEIAVRLARAVLDFQQQLLGTQPRSSRHR